MKPELPPLPDDEAFVADLKKFRLRRPPEAWREQILAAAAVPVPAARPWHRSLFWRAVAAMWVASLGFRLGTPASPAEAAPALAAAPTGEDRRFAELLAALERKSFNQLP
jgi:hypothetical protein